MARPAATGVSPSLEPPLRNQKRPHQVHKATNEPHKVVNEEGQSLIEKGRLLTIEVFSFDGLRHGLR